MNHLIQSGSPQGFVFLPSTELHPNTPALAPHQLLKILRRTRYFIHCVDADGTHVPTGWLSNCFKAGTVPILVQDESQPTNSAFPFDYLTMDQYTLGPALGKLHFEQVRLRFQKDFQKLNSCEAPLADLLIPSQIPDFRKPESQEPFVSGGVGQAA